MRKLLLIIISFCSFLAFAEQGTRSSDKNETNTSPASMSGYEESEPIDLREEEVQLEEDGYDPNIQREEEYEGEQEEQRMREEEGDIHY